MQVVCVYLWVRDGKGGVGVQIRLPIGFVLGNISGKRCYIKASFFKSDTLKSSDYLRFSWRNLLTLNIQIYQEIKRTSSETMAFISKLIYFLKYYIYLTNLHPGPKLVNDQIWLNLIMLLSWNLNFECSVGR